MKNDLKSMSDFEIIQACLSEDNGYFEELVARYKNLIYSIIFRMTSDKEESNDLSQEVFIKIYKNLDKYYPEFKFSTWIIKITTNHVIDHRRKRYQETVPIDDVKQGASLDESPEIAYIKKESENILLEAIQTLPDMYKIPINLYHKQGLSYQEISNIIGEPLSKVKNRIFRGRRMLKKTLTLSKDGDDYEL